MDKQKRKEKSRLLRVLVFCLISICFIIPANSIFAGTTKTIKSIASDKILKNKHTIAPQSTTIYVNKDGKGWNLKEGSRLNLRVELDTVKNLKVSGGYDIGYIKNGKYTPIDKIKISLNNSAVHFQQWSVPVDGEYKFFIRSKSEKEAKLSKVLIQPVIAKKDQTILLGDNHCKSIDGLPIYLSNKAKITFHIELNKAARVSAGFMFTSPDDRIELFTGKSKNIEFSYQPTKGIEGRCYVTNLDSGEIYIVSSTYSFEEFWSTP